jgi:hypothetical protein
LGKVLIGDWILASVVASQGGCFVQLPRALVTTITDSSILRTTHRADVTYTSDGVMGSIKGEQQMTRVTTKLLTIAGYAIVSLSFLASFANGFIFGVAVINRYCC